MENEVTIKTAVQETKNRKVERRHQLKKNSQLIGVDFIGPGLARQEFSLCYVHSIPGKDAELIKPRTNSRNQIPSERGRVESSSSCRSLLRSGARVVCVCPSPGLSCPGLRSERRPAALGRRPRSPPPREDEARRTPRQKRSLLALGQPGPPKTPHSSARFIAGSH